MYNLKNFAKEDVFESAIALRNMDNESANTEETANKIVKYIYSKFTFPDTEESACALVRFFKTHPYQLLEDDVQKAAQALIGREDIPAATQCLTLLGTAGDRPEWNFRQGSNGHQAIPLIDGDFVRGIPMIFQLIRQFGLDVSTVLEGSPTMITQSACRGFNVFYVPEALDSPYIPAQSDFVAPHKVQSVLGFGGLLATGDLFAVILFSKVFIPLETAKQFKWLSAYVRLAAEKFDREKTFARSLKPQSPVKS